VVFFAHNTTITLDMVTIANISAIITYNTNERQQKPTPDDCKTDLTGIFKSQSHKHIWPDLHPEIRMELGPDLGED